MRVQRDEKRLKIGRQALLLCMLQNVLLRDPVVKLK